jgi:maltose O-acetyltransferase
MIADIRSIIPSEISADPKIAAEWHKMLAGEIYEAAAPEFGAFLMKTRKIIKRYNDLEPDSPELKTLLHEILGSCGENIIINQPFHCDFGCNIHLGENFFANFNLTILDEGLVTVGDNCFIGPNVSIYTACHPLTPDERNTGAEWAEPVTIGHNVWIGGNAVITPGVHIGDNSVIGAGAVVTRDVEPFSVVAGNPAKCIRQIIS